ncbi:unnamed protein product [Oreochromis niloticus]|nr:unnamed protein product [Mustela putorius furo]
MFYSSTIESVRTSCIIVFFGKANLATSASYIISSKKLPRPSLPLLQDIFHKRCISKASCVMLDPSQSSHGLFSLLPSGRRCRSIEDQSSKLQHSFFPQAIRLLNSLPHSPPPHTPTQTII